MDGRTMIVRAFGGEPLRRILVGIRGRLADAARPESLDRVCQGLSCPVGFPREDVFQFDEAAFDRLAATWEARRETSADEWARLVAV
jgi:hypothetical protein